MRTLPTMMLHLLNPFVPLFSRRLWPHVQVLLAGAILTPGKRTVSVTLRVIGLGQTEHFQRYHRVLNRAACSGREVSRALLGLLVRTFVASGPLVIGVDEDPGKKEGMEGQGTPPPWQSGFAMLFKRKDRDRGSEPRPDTLWALA
jgi:hypothetical protein